MAETKSKFPEVQPGGSLMLAWQVKGKRVLVVGGGEVAASRILHCLNASALVTCIAPSNRLHPEVSQRIALKQITHVDREYLTTDIDPPNSTFPSGAALTSFPPAPYALVLVATDSPSLSTAIHRQCAALRIPCNVADVPPECDFFFGSVHRDGPVQIMVSTNGKGPRLASTIRKYIASCLPQGAGRAVEAMGELRGRLRERAPGPEEGSKRMGWISRVSDTYTWADMCDFTSEDMDNLLSFYASNTVPDLDALKNMRADPDGGRLDVFDGSFGFSVGA